MSRSVEQGAAAVLDRCVAGPGGCIIWTGGAQSNGYSQAMAEGRMWLGHTLVWTALVGPVTPGMELDHRCGVRRCVNHRHLREVTHQENSQARTGLPANNTSGHRGVYREGKRWGVRVKADGVSHYLGSFATAEEASEAARLGRLRLHRVHADSDLSLTRVIHP